MTCTAIVEDCPDCPQDWRATVPHECDDLCDFDGEQKRRNPDYHAIRHQPFRHYRCGTVLNDRRGNTYEVRRVCRYRTCVLLFCPGCRREVGGWGPVGCPACNGRNGHGTYAEFRRPGAGRLVKPSKRRRHQ